MSGQPSALVDIAYENGIVTALEPKLEAEALEERDLGGKLVLPGFLEAHCHLDKTLTIERVDNASGTLLEAIEAWRAFKPSLTKQDYLERGERALEMALSKGTLALRTHVDVDANGLTALEAVLELKERFRGRVKVQVVALGAPGLGGAELGAMRDALELGADLVGGCPAIRPDGRAEVLAALELAEEYRKGVDLHLDENDDPNSRWLEVLADAVLERSFALPVTAGHCCSLDFMPQADAERIVDKVARVGIHVVTLPACNLVLQGRGRHPVPRGLTRVRELQGRGVNVATATDNVQDPFQPLGNYDLLAAANLTAMAAHLTGTQEILETWQMVTSRAARILGVPTTLEVGSKADFVVLNAKTPLEAVRSVAPRWAVVRGGRALFGMHRSRGLG